MKTAGEVLKKLREQNGDTQEVCAQKLNVARPTVTQYERGTKQLTHPMLVQICKVYNADPKVFF